MTRPVDDARREEVLDLVIRYVADNGLSGLTMRRLAAALGFSTNVISYQFGSKAGLIEAALLRSRTSQRAVYERLLEERPDATASEGFVVIWDWWMADPSHVAYSRLSIEAMMTSSVPGPRVRQSLLAYWVGYFADWLQRDGHTVDRSIELATLLLSVQSGLIIDIVSGGDRERVGAAMHAFARMLRAPAR
jgi:AcrR family transcriptional regulator